MPNIKSSQKRMELGRKWQERNRMVRSRIRTAIKRVRQSEDVDTAETRLRQVVALLDRAGARRLYHPNKVARAKAQLQKFVNGMKAGPAA
jgi:small subunit ribosomal protein S20